MPKQEKSNIINDLENHFKQYSMLLGNQYIIADDDQVKELHTLDNIRHFEIFYFVVDIPTYRVTQFGGINKWLGYSNPFTLSDFFGSLHPAVRDVHLIIAKFLVEKACTGDAHFNFLKSKVIIHHPIRHRDTGDYFYIKRTVTPWQLTKKGQVSAYINRCILISPYNNEPINFKLINLNPDWEPELKKNILDKAPDLLPFSKMEYTVLSEYARRPEMTAEQVAFKLHEEKNTIITYKNRLLAKGREYTQIPFRDVIECGKFFKDIGMV